MSYFGTGTFARFKLQPSMPLPQPGLRSSLPFLSASSNALHCPLNAETQIAAAVSHMDDQLSRDEAGVAAP